MSYGIYIVDPETGEDLETDTPHHITGGTYQIGGTTRLYLNITYNYSPFFYRKETLGESTEVMRDTGKGYMETVEPELGGIYGLQHITIPQARERVLRAINALRDADIDAEGKPYEPIQLTNEVLLTTNYWAPTERNARKALKNLLSLLLLAPDNAKIQVS